MASPLKRIDLATLPLILDDALLWVSDRRDRVRKYALAAALIFFAIGLVWAVRATPDLHHNFSLAPLVLLLIIGAPVSTVLGAVEMHAISRIAGGPMTWRTAFELVVFSSAANMLPLPGGGVAKLAAMKTHGVGFKVGSVMILLSFLIWGGLAFIYAGGALLLLRQTRNALIFLSFGAALLAVCGVGYARFRQWRMVAIVAAMRIFSFPLESFRYLLALMAIGATVGFLQSSIFVIASFIGSAVVFVPSGLGVTEAASALLSPVVGVSAAMGFIGAVVGRIVRLLGLALVAGGMLWLPRTGSSGGNHSGSA